MATNLAQAGFDLTVFDIDGKTMDKMRILGAACTRSPQEMAQGLCCATVIGHSLLPTNFHSPPDRRLQSSTSCIHAIQH
jgi:hypothetical protein